MKRALNLLIIMMLFGHFTVLAFFLLPDNPVSHQYRYQIQGYVHPWFTQSWNLFAPNPVNTNVSILVQFKVYRNKQAFSSEWCDIVKPLLEQKQRQFWSPVQRVLKHISSIGIDIAETRKKVHDYIQKSDSLKGDTQKAMHFYKEVYRHASGHQAIMAYSRYVYRRLASERHWPVADSVKVVYKILDQEFPRFSNRKQDYFNLKNYRFRQITSDEYRLY